MENNMISQTSNSNIINFKKKPRTNKQVSNYQSEKKMINENTQIISVTSGKGGVGKTNIVANMGISFSKKGKKVLILDADLGLGNLDILLGLAPKYNLSHVISGDKKLSEILIDFDSHMSILPASSGIDEFSQLSERQQSHIIKELNSVLENFDILIIDTGAGISSAVMYFNTLAEEVIIVVSPEPTSITDAYALMKVLSIKYSASKFKLLINQAKDAKEAKTVFMQLRLVTDRFINISLDYLGHIQYDSNISTSVKNQKAVVNMFPNTCASVCFNNIINDYLN